MPAKLKAKFTLFLAYTLYIIGLAIFYFAPRPNPQAIAPPYEYFFIAMILGAVISIIAFVQFSLGLNLQRDNKRFSFWHITLGVSAIVTLAIRWLWPSGISSNLQPVYLIMGSLLLLVSLISIVNGWKAFPMQCTGNNCTC